MEEGFSLFCMEEWREVFFIQTVKKDIGIGCKLLRLLWYSTDTVAIYTDHVGICINHVVICIDSDGISSLLLWVRNFTSVERGFCYRYKVKLYPISENDLATVSIAVVCVEMLSNNSSRKSTIILITHKAKGYISSMLCVLFQRFT